MNVRAHLKMYPDHVSAQLRLWESAKVSHKRAFALMTPEKSQLQTAKNAAKTVFALPGCQPISLNTLLCDTLGLAESSERLRPELKVSLRRCPASFCLGLISCANVAPFFFMIFLKSPGARTVSTKEMLTENIIATTSGNPFL